MTSIEGFIVNQIEFQLQLSQCEISLSDSLVALGGNSLEAIQFVKACKERGIQLSVQDVLTAPSISGIISLANMRTADGPQDAAFDQTNNISLASNYYFYGSFGPYPMTEMQLTLAQGSHSSPGTNIIRYVSSCFKGRAPALRHAWNKVLQQEPIFRTRFFLHEGEGYLLDDEKHRAFEWEEMSISSQQDYASYIQQRSCMTEVSSRFTVVFREYDKEKRVSIIWDVHHALIDGFSMRLLLEKVNRSLRGQPVTPGPPFRPCALELHRLQQMKGDLAKEFWKRQRQRYPQPSDAVLLPCPRLPPEDVRYEKRSFRPRITLEDLHHNAKMHGVTRASLFIAAWTLTLFQFCDSDVVVFGVVLSGRNPELSGATETIGPLLNTLPFHGAFEKNSLVEEFIHAVFSQLVELAAFQWTTPEHGFTRTFSSAVAMQFETELSPGLTGQGNDHSASILVHSDIPLSIMVDVDGSVHLHYQNTYFTADQIELLGEQYLNALSILCYHTSSTMDDCLEALLSPLSRQRLLGYGNCHSGLTTKTSVHDDLVTLFERAAACHPDFPALEQSAQSITYRQLDEMSSCVAEYLHINIGLRPGEVVCVHADQSFNWIVATYAVLKAHGVYCPLNQTLTPELRASTFESSGSRIYLVPDKTVSPTMSPACQFHVVVGDLITRENTSLPHEEEMRWPARERPQPASVAYLCFTSGSTGQPKGVLCTHQGLVAFQRNLEVRLFASPGRRIAQIMSVSFDGSIHEIFSALSYGATLVLPDPSDPFSNLHRVDSAILTPSIAKILVPIDFPRLENVYLVGEPVPQDVNDSWGSSKRTYNMYGPTEATCGATITMLRPQKPVTIGRCNPSTRIYVLNRHRRLVPLGVIGEIFLAGVQVSKGYLNRPQATRERFFDDCVCTGLEEEMYATGDLGYWNDDGELICLGRNDRQIKLRGFRVDLDDLEARIGGIPGVMAVAVTRKGDHLVAIIQPRDLPLVEIRQQLKAILPAHATPRRILCADQFPMTAAGKRDYNQISTMFDSAGSSPDRGTMTLYEQKVARVWAEMLQIPGTTFITPSSSFADLGGHSVLQIRLASRLSTIFALQIPPRLVIQAPTLKELAREIQSLDGTRVEPEHKTLLSELEVKYKSNDLSLMEQEWVNKYRVGGCGTSSFNVSFAYRMGDEIVRSRLTNAWNEVLGRHQILRSRYSRDGDGCWKRIYSDHPPRVRVVQSVDISKEVNQPFDLGAGDPIRVTCDNDVCVITATHTICDLTTMQILLDEAAIVYKGEANLVNDLPYLESPVWAKSLSPEDVEFWAAYLDGLPTLSPPLLPNFRASRAGYNGSSIVSILPESVSTNLQSHSRRAGVTIHQLCMGAVALALQSGDTEPDILMGAPHLNRLSEDDMHTVGLFLEPLAVRIRFSQSDSQRSVSSFLQSIKQSSQAALAHAAPWSQLWRHFVEDPDRYYPNHPLFDVMVTFHDEEMGLKLGVDTVHPLLTWAEGSKFKLLFEFTAVNSKTTLLRIEYDSALFSPQEIRSLYLMAQIALENLVKDSEWQHIGPTLKVVLDLATSPEPSTVDQPNIFGASVDAISLAL